ncbi:MAG TPA: hypothetical protein VLW44_21820 [Streptosporangiaceae bacterium]|nr:hypothetical protein [Streptosporangiaceae bacterium]
MSQQDTSGPTAPAASPAATPAPAPPAATAGWPERVLARHWVQHVLVLAGFLAAGVAVTWPRASYLAGRVPLDGDQIQYVWSFWWVARQVIHFGNPWFTTHLAAPVGVQLGYDTLMPLPGVVMTPITLLFGPSASYNLLTIVAPGLAAYAMYRAARLWLPGQIGPIAAGAFYGLSGMLTSQDWLHIHTAIGCVFLPLTLEVAVRLRRDPTIGRGVVLGLVVGASVLTDQETAVLATIVAALALVPWLLGRPSAARLRAVAVGAVTAAVIASPQVLAMLRAAGRGGPAQPPVTNYVRYAARLPSLFAPSPRLADFGLTGLASIYNAHLSRHLAAAKAHEMLATFGVVLTLMAVLGLVVSWRRPRARPLAALWLGCAALALGPTLYIGAHQLVPLATTWRGIRVSLLMPYTWMIRLPVLSSFREADRLALLGLVGAALLAGAGVDWLRRRAWPLLIVVAALGLLEAGYSAIPGEIAVSTTLPAVDRPIAADHSASVVVDVPFVIRGPEVYGTKAPPFALALATADGHPRGISVSSAVPRRTIAGIRQHPFYAGLVAAEKGRTVTPAQLAAARQDLRELKVGWILVWPPKWIPNFPLGTAGPPPRHLHYQAIQRYLTETGAVLDYQADGVMVYRPSALPRGQA